MRNKMHFSGQKKQRQATPSLLHCFALAIALLAALPATAGTGDSLQSTQAPRITQGRVEKSELENYLQYGFRIGTDIALDTRWLSDRDHLNSLLSGTFGFYVRGGYKYIFGELGLNYMFYKGQYEVYNENMQLAGNEKVESRYLQIPLRVVGNIGLGKSCHLLPNAGITYQPFIHCSKNDIGYGKQNLTRHQFLYHAGLDFRVKFFNIGVAYKRAMRPFFSNRSSIKQSYLNITLGITL